MPGGRLTHEDRRRIADGLVRGLNYTEIAARLERPLSTVTREVTRNGGPAAYRADDAELATRERARRERPAPDRTAPDTGPGAAGDLEEQFTAIMVATGLPRMTARVLACLYLTDSGSMTAAELSDRLQVSPASISKAIGDLEGQDLIRREKDPRRRRDRYVIDADAWFRGWMASARQNVALARIAHQGAAALGPASPAGVRLQDFGDFFDQVGHAMIEAAEQWREARPAREPRA